MARWWQRSLNLVDLVNGLADQRSQFLGFGLGVSFVEFAFEKFLECGDLFFIIINGGFEFI